MGMKHDLSADGLSGSGCESLQVEGIEAQMRDLKKRRKKNIAVAGDRTRVTRVTGGNTHHYTTTTCLYICRLNIFFDTIIALLLTQRQEGVLAPLLPCFVTAKLCTAIKLGH